MTDHGAALACALYPRVSEILRDMGLAKPYPEGNLNVEWGRARGSAVHKAIQLWEQDSLNVGTLHPDVIGPFTSYLRFKEETGYTPEAVEEAVCHAGLRYRGTLDSRGSFRGTEAVLDFKVSKQPDMTAAAYQLSAYALAWCFTSGARPMPARYVVQLGDESYRVRPVSSPDAVDIFTSAVRVWHAQREPLALPIPEGAA